MLIGQTNRFAMAVRQRLGLTLLSAAINWAYGVDHMLRGKLSARRNHGLASGQPSNLADDLTALGQNGRSSSTMNRPINAASAEQRRVGRVHDRLGGFFDDVARPVNLDDFLTAQQKSHKEVLSCQFSVKTFRVMLRPMSELS
jgi:hypothetical protein